MKKVVLTGYIIIPNDERDEILSAFEIHKKLTLAETGCITFQITPCKDDTNKFMVYEEFINIDAFAEHQQRVKNSAWGKISTNVARHYQPVREIED